MWKKDFREREAKTALLNLTVQWDCVSSLQHTTMGSCANLTASFRKQAGSIKQGNRLSWESLSCERPPGGVCSLFLQVLWLEKSYHWTTVWVCQSIIGILKSKGKKKRKKFLLFLLSLTLTLTSLNLHLSLSLRLCRWIRRVLGVRRERAVVK